MYTGPADVTFFQHSMHLPSDRYIFYFNEGVDITLSVFASRLAQLEFEAGLVGIEGAIRLRVRLPNGREYEGDITPRAATRGVTSLLFKLHASLTEGLRE